MKTTNLLLFFMLVASSSICSTELASHQELRAPRPTAKQPKPLPKVAGKIVSEPVQANNTDTNSQKAETENLQTGTTLRTILSSLALIVASQATPTENNVLVEHSIANLLSGLIGLLRMAMTKRIIIETEDVNKLLQQETSAPLRSILNAACSCNPCLCGDNCSCVDCTYAQGTCSKAVTAACTCNPCMCNDVCNC